MRIREADLQRDALAIMSGAQDFVSRIEFSELLPQGEGLVEAVARIVAMDGMEILVAEHNGKVVAGLGIYYTPYMWNQDIIIADELFWWSAPDAPFRAAAGLFHAAMERIESRDAVPVFRALTTSSKGVERMYRREGLKPMETVFSRIG